MNARWGWDTIDTRAPEHLAKHALTEAAWARICQMGYFIYPTVGSQPNWSTADALVNGAYNLGLKLIYQSAFHPAGLTDAEIEPWMIEFNRQVLERYGDKLYGIQPVNEPWLADEWSGNTPGWAYQYKRLGTSTPRNGEFWVGGNPANGVTADATVWLKKLRSLLVGVKALANARGVKVFGPHWTKANYVPETLAAKQAGVLDGVDVFTFGHSVEGEPDGNPALANNYKDGWAHYIDDIIPMLDGRRWACLEFHLNHGHGSTLLDAPDYVRAGQIKRGIEYWRDMGVLCVLVHIGLQDWNTQCDDLTSRLCGYINNRPEETLRVIQVALAASQGAPMDNTEVLARLATLQSAVSALKPPVLPTVTQAEIDACAGVSSSSARDIVTKHKGKVIVP